MSTRPTPARVREALFSILAAHLPDARVLDLFAGTGALGIEALSRGAAHATFVDQDRRVHGFLTRNVAPFAQQATLLAMSAAQAVAHLGQGKQQFDLIFMDPPYHQGLLNPTLEIIAKQALLSSTGVVVCEHFTPAEPPHAPAGWQCFKQRAFGDVSISLWGTAVARDQGSPP